MSSNVLQKKERSFEREVLEGNVRIEVGLGEIVAWIEANLAPEDVFDENDLDCWAYVNGYEKV